MMATLTAAPPVPDTIRCSRFAAAAAALRTAGPEYPGSAAARRDRPPIDRCPARVAWRSSDRKIAARPLPHRPPQRCRAGASCAATGSSASGSPLPIPTAARTTDPPERSFPRQRRGAPWQRRLRRSGRSSRAAPATDDARRATPGPEARPRSETRRERMRTCRLREAPHQQPWVRELCKPASLLSAEKQESAAELTLGGWHFARGAWIDRDRGPQRPRQTLETGFGDMMAVLAI